MLEKEEELQEQEQEQEEEEEQPQLQANQSQSLFANLGETLRKRGISKMSFAKKIGVTNVSLQRWVAGNNYPSYEMLRVICNELGLTASEILGF